MAKDTMSKDIMDILSPVLGEELAAAVIEHRRRTLRKPLTAYAARIQAREYLLTGDPAGAAEMQIFRGWQAIKCDWYLKEKARSRVDQQQYEKDDSGCRKRFPLR